ncbi:MAG: hypothetical protein M1833_001825 [Piccolia ochrophora]|nr:MAG: hypothetical protein M1833_001825 [Piccolia ochrophora]
MDDLSGLDWASGSDPSKGKVQVTSSMPLYPPMQPTPSPSISGRSTPLHAVSNAYVKPGTPGSKPPSKSSTPANDSFSNLVNFGSTKSSNSVSLQERQRQLQVEKLNQQRELKRNMDAQFGGQDNEFWETLEKKNVKHSIQGRDGDTALLDITKIDAASHSPSATYGQLPLSAGPTSSVGANLRHVPASQNEPSSSAAAVTNQPEELRASSWIGRDNDDDDPFGLRESKSTAQLQGGYSAPAGEDEDILGLLGKPVSKSPKPTSPQAIPSTSDSEDTSPTLHSTHLEKGVSELVDMGFPIGKAREALAMTESGSDVQAAVAWLLNEAHRRTREQPHDRSQGGLRAPSSDGRGQRGATTSLQRRETKSSHANGDRDVSKVASEVSSNLLKSANSLWQTGRKKVQKAVNDFQNDGDPNQPKWMREPQLTESLGPRPSTRSTHDAQPANNRNQVTRAKGPDTRDQDQDGITDEALILEVGDAHRPVRKKDYMGNSEARTAPASTGSSRTPSPALSASSQRSHRLEVSGYLRRDGSRPRSSLTKQMVEEESSQIYISPARRKNQSPKPAEKNFQSPKPDTHDLPAPAVVPVAAKRPSPTPSPLSSAAPPAISTMTSRPKASARRIPPTSSSSLVTSERHRQIGSESFKRGDFAAAHTSYSSALSPLPPGHPITIVVLCNRALVNIKIGDPKASIADADLALKTIGNSQGEGERIALGGEGGDKDMRDFFGKALTRKAEAQEQLERWGDAAKTWKEAVGAGVGGATSIQGRNRCEKAAGNGSQQNVGKSNLASRPPPAKKPPPRKPSALSDLAHADAASSSEAVSRLRAANAAAEQAEDEKFALADTVDAKLTTWKAGKSDNLRALLGSLDNLLWPEAGWKKVGMHELVVPGKVKIIYMKAIAKVHPDKISTTASTEQRMISGAVFSTLNEAWDKFKKGNGL